jgi:hypothetical protein
MRTVSEREVLDRMRVENPWWAPPHAIDAVRRALPRREYFDLFFPFVGATDPRRALILMGPRRVGKTVMLHQSVQKLLDSGVAPTTICYLDLQTPLYNGIPLERLLKLARSASGHNESDLYYILFDEIQYLPQWEVHLKNLVDSHSDVKFIASGSAAAALRLKSTESGAGRFTDFLLPPVTFYEYLKLAGEDEAIAASQRDDDSTPVMTWERIDELNEHFFDYLNVGGYPEAIFSQAVRGDPGRYIRSDIIDKVLMKDLPSLYGIHDIQELNSLFTMLAYNTGNEVSLDALSSNAGVAKNTIKRYLEYLESAFLIKIVHRVDRSAKRFKRANFFKVYLTNPCMRSALFSPLEQDDEGAGHLVETGVFSQWFHSAHSQLYYARWSGGAGEVDLVRLGPNSQQPRWAVEVKWSDRCLDDASELSSLKRFLAFHPRCTAYVSTRTVSGTLDLAGCEVGLIPSAVYCYYVGWNVIRMKQESLVGVSLVRPPDRPSPPRAHS